MMKWVEVKPLPDKLAVQVAWFIYEEIICRYGCLAIIQSDNGLKFVNALIAKLCKEFGIFYQQIILYRSQANGLVKRFN